MNETDIANRLKTARIRAGYKTAREAAVALGIRYSTYAGHENGGRGLSRAAPRYAKKFKVSLDWLLRGDGTGPAPLEDDANVAPGPDIQRINVPVISWVQAGAFAEVPDISTTDEWVTATQSVGQRSFALRIKGDSMEPDFPEGMVVVFDPDLDPVPGDFVVAQNGDNEATFKRLVKDGSDWFLQPCNPRYPIKPLGSSRIIAVAREAVKKLR